MALIEVNEASYSYPSGLQAVQQVSFQVEAGDRIAMIGQNGAGKTTTAKLLNGLLKPTEGTVLVNGKNTKKYTTAQIARDVGYVFQNPDDQMFNSRVYDEIAYGLVQAGAPDSEVQERVVKYANLCGVSGFLEKNPYDLPLSVRKLVTIASVLSTFAEVIILDEPTGGQDLRGLRILGRILDHLKLEGRAVLTITHDMEFVNQHFDQVIVMAQKQVKKEGHPLDIFYDQDLMDLASLTPPMIVQVIQTLGIDIKTLNPQALAQKLNEI